LFTIGGCAELIEPYGLADRQKRNANLLKIYHELQQITRIKTTAEWLAICDDIDLACAPIYALGELLSNPHLQAVHLFEDAEHPTEGPIRQIRPTALFSQTPTRIRRPAPTLGEHTAQVLAQAGISAGDTESE
jgi:formyl-CoA transferase